jgi:hypothetical protein
MPREAAFDIIECVAPHAVGRAAPWLLDRQAVGSIPPRLESGAVQAEGDEVAEPLPRPERQVEGTLRALDPKALIPS